jgi:hypothetical protein
MHRCPMPARTPTPRAARGRGERDSVATQASSARAKAPPSLEERIQAIGGLVDGLGVASPLPRPAGGSKET